MDELNKITCKLVSFNTVKEKKKEIDACLNYIKKYFSDPEFVIREYQKNGYKSLFISYNQARKVKLLLNGHIDVVTGKPEQFKPYQKNEKICGRGTADMKAGVAGMMLLMKEFVDQKPDMGLMIVTDEEMGGFNGTNYLLNEEDISADFAIAAEPNKSQTPERLDITIAHKGVLWLKIKQQGKSAHASLPWNGENAIEKLIEDYLRIKAIFEETTVKDRWKTTLNLSKITGGKTTNSVPDQAKMVLDIRYTDDTNPKKLIKQIKGVISGELEELELSSGLYTKQNNKDVKKLQQSVEKTTTKECKLIRFHGSSDMRFTSEKGIPSVILGPYGENYHADNEFVYEKSLEMFYNSLKLFVETSLLKN